MDFSAGALFVSFVAGLIGMACFIYGKKQHRAPQLVGGIALMVYPYFIAGAGVLAGVGAAILAVMILAVRAGY